MDACEEAGDAAAEQLYDELTARTWGLHQVLRSVTTDVARRDMIEQLATAADRHVAALRGDDPVADPLRRLLWPSGAIPVANDPRWATPQGQLIPHPSARQSLPSRRSVASCYPTR